MRIGFLGFGEAGFHIAKGLLAHNAEEMAAYDIHSETPGRSDIIKRRAAEARVRLTRSNAELAGAADTLFSVVTCDQALAAAMQTVSYLEPRHHYVDLNSVSPAVKQALAGVIQPSGARFIEIAVMAPVP